MSYQKNFKKLTTSCFVAAGIATGATLILAPAAEAHHHYNRHEFRRTHHDYRHGGRYLPRCRRSYRRNWRNVRRGYGRNLFGYTYGLPGYGYGYQYRPRPGIDIQIRL